MRRLTPDGQVSKWKRLARDCGFTNDELLLEIAGLVLALDKKLADLQRDAAAQGDIAKPPAGRPWSP